MCEESTIGLADDSGKVKDMYMQCDEEPIPDCGKEMLHEMLDGMVWGFHDAFDQACSVMEGGVRTRRPLLLLGGHGTGKSAFANALSCVLLRPVVTVSCGKVLIHGDDLLEQVAMTGKRNCILLFEEIDHAGPDVLRLLLRLSDNMTAGRIHDGMTGEVWDATACTVVATFGIDGIIPTILIDRGLLIPFPRFKASDKVLALKECVIPRTIKEMGLTGKLLFSDDVPAFIVSHSSDICGLREAVWSVAHVCRKMAEANDVKDAMDVGIEDVRKFLDLKKPVTPDFEDFCSAGLATGIGMPVSGLLDPGTFTIGANLSDGSEGVDVIGSCDDSFKASCHEAYIAARGQADWMPGAQTRMHVTISFSGVEDLSGPSAGLAVAVAIYSAFMGMAVPPWVAMTGTCSSKGKIGKVGAVEQKVAAAQDDGCLAAIVPEANKEDALVGGGHIKIVSVKTFDEVVELLQQIVAEVSEYDEAMAQEEEDDEEE